nr:MAG TPA: hypothetical protein [Caudoviricetes sp.]
MVERVGLASHKAVCWNVECVGLKKAKSNE